MMYLIISLFALAAVMGLIVAAAIFAKKPETPKAAVIAHGLFGATALVLLIVYMINNPESNLGTIVIIFVVAALGGAYLLINDLRKKPGPVSVVVIHALIAVSAFVMLLAFAFF